MFPRAAWIRCVRQALGAMTDDYAPPGEPRPLASPTLMLGYANVPEPAIRAGVRELAAVVRAARPSP